MINQNKIASDLAAVIDERDQLRQQHQGQAEKIVALRTEVDRLRAGFERLADELRTAPELDEGEHVAGRIQTVLWGPGHHNGMQGWIPDREPIGSAVHDEVHEVDDATS